MDMDEAGEESGWVAAARGGDRDAFGRLYTRFAPMVHGLLMARVPRTDVEDLVQDVFLRAMRRLESLRDGTAFGPWVAAIARHRSVDHFRRRRPSVVLPEDLPAPGSAPEEGAGAREALEAIRALPEAYRETLVLRLVEGMTGPEIAARTGLTPGSVRVNLHRGMKMLRERLGEAR